jgi:hypothetical protein
VRHVIDVPVASPGSRDHSQRSKTTVFHLLLNYDRRWSSAVPSVIELRRLNGTSATLIRDGARTDQAAQRDHSR